MAPDQVPPNNFPNTLANCAIGQYARRMTTTPDASARDELAEIIDRGEHYYDTGSHYELSATDAAYTILAAGYRKPSTITTAEELDALPNGSVVMGFDVDREQLVSAKQYGEWRQAGTDDGWQAHGLIENSGELVVLWEPEA